MSGQKQKIIELVGCPVCKQPPGKPCLKGGKPRARSHQHRMHQAHRHPKWADYVNGRVSIP